MNHRMTTYQNEPLQMTLVAALDYLADNLGLPEGEIISLNFFRREGRELQAIALEEFEGMVAFKAPIDPNEDFEHIKSPQFVRLFELLHEHGLSLQFIDSYPMLDGWDNFRALILSRKTAQDALHRVEGTLGMVPATKACLQSDATPLRRNGAAGRTLPLTQKSK
jgi:hypothetical protein